MTKIGHLSRNRAADSRGVSSNSAAGRRQPHRNYRNFSLTRFDIAIDVVRGQMIEVKSPAMASAESLLLLMVEAPAADSPMSNADEQLLSLP